MEDKEIEQRYNYSLVQVYPNDDLRWIRAVIGELWNDGKISFTEYSKIRTTLERI